MACERFQNRLIEAAATSAETADWPPAGGLDSSFLARVTDAGLAAHLANCPDCRRGLAMQLELQRQIVAGVAAVVAAGPSPSLAACVRLRAAAESPSRRSAPGTWILAGAIAAASVVLWFAIRAAGPSTQIPLSPVSAGAPAQQARVPQSKTPPADTSRAGAQQSVTPRPQLPLSPGPSLAALAHQNPRKSNAAAQVASTVL
ncbi:MAG: hypothetical protein ACRD5L_15965, partial [Bryobacteraceae bacterium]